MPHFCNSFTLTSANNTNMNRIQIRVSVTFAILRIGSCFESLYYLKILQAASQLIEAPAIFENINENLIGKASESKKILDIFKKEETRDHSLRPKSNLVGMDFFFIYLIKV